MRTHIRLGLPQLVCVFVVLAMVFIASPLFAKPPSRGGVSLELEAPWTASAAGPQAVSAFVHEAEDLRVELIVLDLGEDGEATGEDAVDAWLKAFIDDDPRVSATKSATKLPFADAKDAAATELRLVFEDRSAYVLAFSAKALAGSLGRKLTRDRFAYFVLIEGPGGGGAAWDKAVTEVRAGLAVGRIP